MNAVLDKVWKSTYDLRISYHTIWETIHPVRLVVFRLYFFFCFRSYDMHALFKGNRRSQAKIEAELLWLKLGGRSWLVKGLFFSFVAGQGSWAGKMHLGVSPGAL